MTDTRILTPILLDALPDVLVAGYHTVTGSAPHPNTIAIAWSQLCVEHRDWERRGWLDAVVNWNFGNHDATAEEIANGPTFKTVPEREIINGRETKAKHIRAAYATAEDGAAGYWARLIVGYNEAFYLMPLGSPTQYATALRSKGYFTEVLSKYVNGMEIRLARYQARWPVSA